MAQTRQRSPVSEPQLAKRHKLSHDLSALASSPKAVVTVPESCFHSRIFDNAYIEYLNRMYESGEPFKHTVIEKLFQDDLLERVKDECLQELSFTEKETDIYKVNQTGDLASLSYLESSQIALLPNLLVLRDALYSEKFRSFIRTVTGCGSLSGKKQDMSVNSYRKGCHLLNHDDAIGTRRVSYILYMPLPHLQPWQKDWGGALELYPTKIGPGGIPEPTPAPQKSIPPSWNQFIFFEVQPGKSFHSVEEVVVGGPSDEARERLSVSGWFHAAQHGEEGYQAETATSETKSSLEQLISCSTAFSSYPDNSNPPLPNTDLSDQHVSFLSEFLNPVYVQSRTMKALSQRFVEESSLELHHFLNQPLAERLESSLREIDTQEGLSAARKTPIPPHTAGTSSGWEVKGPPHKQRYCVLEKNRNSSISAAVCPRAAQTSAAEAMRSLQDEVLPSAAFRAWLAIITNLIPLRYSSEARRFRPGLDYTLATSEEKEARLDVVLGVTPEATPPSDRHQTGDTESPGEGEASGWQSGEWGGWECYMAPHGGEEDPAVYRSGSSKKLQDGNSASNDGLEQSPDHVDDESDEDASEGTLLTSQPGFNRLLVVLRDERVMHFVKYVSAAAEGSRWDVCGEYEIGMVQQDSDDSS